MEHSRQRWFAQCSDTCQNIIPQPAAASGGVGLARFMLVAIKSQVSCDLDVSMFFIRGSQVLRFAEVLLL